MIVARCSAAAAANRSRSFLLFGLHFLHADPFRDRRASATRPAGAPLRAGRRSVRRRPRDGVASARSSRGQSTPVEQVGDHDDEAAPPGARAGALRARRPASLAVVRSSHTRALLDVVQQREHRVATAARRAHLGRRHRRSSTAATRLPGLRGEEPERGRGREREVALLAARGAEVEARGAVDDEPGLELAVGDRVAHVGRVRPGRQAPVDAAHVVARLVQPGVARFAARTTHVALVVAVEQAVELAVDEEIELPEPLSRSR